MPEQFHEIPGRLIRAVRIIPLKNPQATHTLCKACFCEEYEIDETSVSTAIAEPQPDLLIEKFKAITDPGKCPRCRKPY